MVESCQNLTLVQNLISQTKRPLLLSHHNPDGDAIGSLVGLALTLAQEGARPALHLVGTWAGHLSFLLDEVEIDESISDPGQYDLIILLDCHGFDRLGSTGADVASRLAHVSSPAPQVVIDHHLLSEGEDIKPTWLLEVGASSTGELVWRILSGLGLKPPRLALQALLIALVSDTGFFCQTNTTAASLRAAADLVDLGGNMEEVSRCLKENKPLKTLKLKAEVLRSLEVLADGRVAVMKITPDMLARAGAEMKDAENFVEIGRGLAGATLSVLIKDPGTGPGTVRVSLRSRDHVEARGLATLFGGGGHRQAAAYSDPQAANADDAVANLMARVYEFL